MRDLLGYTVEWIDVHVLGHRYMKVCAFCYWLLNGKVER